MLEIILAVGLCGVMAKVATIEDKSPIIWGAITFLCCLASGVIPLPFLRIMIGGALALTLYIVVKFVRD